MTTAGFVADWFQPRRPDIPAGEIGTFSGERLGARMPADGKSLCEKYPTTIVEIERISGSLLPTARKRSISSKTTVLVLFRCFVVHAQEGEADVDTSEWLDKLFFRGQFQRISAISGGHSDDFGQTRNFSDEP